MTLASSAKRPGVEAREGGKVALPNDQLGGG